MTELLDELKKHQTDEQNVEIWHLAAPTFQFPRNGGACVKYKNLQIAVFNFENGKKWYACQNLCPHKMQMVLSRGITGSDQSEPKVACPFHKTTFSLQSGKCLNGEEEHISVYPVKIKNDNVYIGFSK